MSLDAILSRPRYSPLALDPTGRRHLVVAEGPSVPADAVEGAEIWTVAHDSRPIPGPTSEGGDTRRRVFRATAHLLAMLRHRLAKESLGFRLYAVGSESFLWDVGLLAREFGLGAGEYRPTQAGTLRRRVYCVHCKSMTENVSTSIVACSGCGASLFVRDHFSRRLAAFMGFQIDSEVPGEVPAAEEAYP